MPCIEWFDAQTPAYRQQVLPPDVKARVSVDIYDPNVSDDEMLALLAKKAARGVRILNRPGVRAG